MHGSVVDEQCDGGAGQDREFDAVLERIRDRRIPHWADPQQTQPDQIADRGGSRAVYFADPSGHWIEVLTR